MTVGFTILCHTALDRVAQVARHLAERGSPVVIHVDARVPADGLRARLADLETVRFCRRHAVDWGGWSVVAAQISAAETMLAAFPQADHVFAASGACLPLRPPADLCAYLARHRDTDFIESVNAAEVSWTVGGFDAERFTLYFPFSWQRQRRLFDRAVAWQRRLGVRRTLPPGLVPHLGSQWWCLTRATLAAILSDPARAHFDRFFRQVWIPDEAYFQSLARRHARAIESRPLTLSQFDFQGKPHVFYDDHLELLRDSGGFAVRKIWPRAEALYAHFLSDAAPDRGGCEPRPAALAAACARATRRRTRGRAGLYMQSRFPRPGHENGATAAPYSVHYGLAELFAGFEAWIAAQTGACVHGRLFAPDRVAFAGGAATFAGALSDSVPLRDHNPCGFLTNLIWAAGARHQGFQLTARDNPEINGLLTHDPNARLSVITGSWALGLFRAPLRGAALRREAAWLQQRELALTETLRGGAARARVRIWTLAQAVADPAGPLHAALDAVPGAHPAPATLPGMVDLAGFGRFLQTLRNEGMKPMQTGDFAIDDTGPGERSHAAQ